MSKSLANFWLDVATWGIWMTTTVTGLVLSQVLAPSPNVESLGLSYPVWMALHGVTAVLGPAGVGLHVAWHWDWLRALRGRSLRTMPARLRANRVVDRVMWIGFFAANALGALAAVLPLDGLSGGVSLPVRLHVALSIAWSLTAVVHLALHWSWIAVTARRCLASDRPRAADWSSEGGP